MIDKLKRATTASKKLAKKVVKTKNPITRERLSKLGKQVDRASSVEFNTRLKKKVAKMTPNSSKKSNTIKRKGNK